MKNLRNLMAWITLMVVLMMGANAANAGVLLGDRSVIDSNTCTTDVKLDIGGILTGLAGIVLAGRNGIVLAGRDGIVLAGKSGAGCQEQSRDGILLAD